jgi:hypothetical protein
MSNWANGLAGLMASVAAVIVSVCCAFLVWRQQRRLTAMEKRLDRHGSAIHSLEAAHSDLITRPLHSPKLRRSRKAPKRSGPSMGTVPESSSFAPERPEGDSKGPVLSVVAPKTSPE